MNKQSNNSPNVSVVMPVYNGERTLMEAVDSVLNQTYQDFELIICNDASTDETQNLLKKITDDRVKIILNLHNLGEGPTRDRAIELARGAWIAVIDADDAWAPERLEVMLREADGSTDKMIFDDIIECHDTPSGMVPCHVLRGKCAFGGNGVDTVEVPIADFVCKNRLLIKPLFPLKYVKKYKVLHSSRRFAEDTEFFLTLLAYGLTIRYVPRAMYYYRITPGSMSALANRSSLMREVLENAVDQFGHAPSIQKALHKKIAMIYREEKLYTPFFLALKKKDIMKALKILYQAPWIIPAFFSYLPERLFYHIHRVWHGGRTRGIR
jgi:succinoglycan biosynthesis protein ExoO